MKKASLPLLIGLIALTGCAHHYVMKLNNGAQITTANKPKLKESTYYFKDAKGEEHFVPVSRVREVAPVSVAEREDKPKPLKAEPPKKRKWYLLWLG
jgi:type IV secretory pathway TraG/TraD family ATPase VirD4